MCDAYPVLHPPISPLQQRLIDDMTLRQFSQETQRNYIGDVGRIATFLRRSPDTATADDLSGSRSGSRMTACRFRTDLRFAKVSAVKVADIDPSVPHDSLFSDHGDWAWQLASFRKVFAALDRRFP